MPTSHEFGRKHHKNNKDVKENSKKESSDASGKRSARNLVPRIFGHSKSSNSGQAARAEATRRNRARRTTNVEEEQEETASQEPKAEADEGTAEQEEAAFEQSVRGSSAEYLHELQRHLVHQEDEVSQRKLKIVEDELILRNVIAQPDVPALNAYIRGHRERLRELTKRRDKAAEPASLDAFRKFFTSTATLRHRAAVTNRKLADLNQLIAAETRLLELIDADPRRVSSMHYIVNSLDAGTAKAFAPELLERTTKELDQLVGAAGEHADPTYVAKLELLRREKAIRSLEKMGLECEETLTRLLVRFEQAIAEHTKLLHKNEKRMTKWTYKLHKRLGSKVPEQLSQLNQDIRGAIESANADVAEMKMLIALLRDPAVRERVAAADERWGERREKLLALKERVKSRKPNHVERAPENERGQNEHVAKIEEALLDVETIQKEVDAMLKNLESM